MGSPGAGKGTLAARLSSLNIEHLSSGHLFRREIEKRTPVGRAIEESMEHGELVPDELTLDLVRKWFRGRPPSRGFILDGFPRTLVQARCFDEWMEARNEVLTACVVLELPEEATVKRLSDRRICPKDGTAYHLLFNPPANGGVCDACGTELVQREDDKEAVVRRRYRLYRERTRPLLDHYRNQGLLREFSAEIRPDEVARQVFDAFNLKPEAE